jgi:hypothetical protein
MMMNKRAMTLVALSTLVLSMAGCGDGKSSSSSSSYSGPSGLSSDQKDKYNNMSPEGKKYVDEQMRAYDKGKR